MIRRSVTLEEKVRGAYVLMQLTTPRWYRPRNPHPANERFILAPLPSAGAITAL